MYKFPPMTMEQSDYVGILAIAIALWIFLKAFAARKSRFCESNYPKGKNPSCETRMLLSGPTVVDRILCIVFIADIATYQCPQCRRKKRLWRA